MLITLVIWGGKACNSLIFLFPENCLKLVNCKQEGLKWPPKACLSLRTKLMRKIFPSLLKCTVLLPPPPNYFWKPLHVKMKVCALNIRLLWYFHLWMLRGYIICNLCCPFWNTLYVNTTDCERFILKCTIK